MVAKQRKDRITERAMHRMIPWGTVVGQKHMLEYVENHLTLFQNCFTREKVCDWFLVIVVGLLVRSDRLETTSTPRDLALNGSL